MKQTILTLIGLILATIFSAPEAMAERVPPRIGLALRNPASTPDDGGLMETFQAEDIDGATPDNTKEDHAPVKWIAFHYDKEPREITWEDVTVVSMRPLDPVLRLQFEDLDIGMYELRIFGRVDRPDEEIPQYREPLFIELRVNDGPNGEINRYRMRCPYDNMHRDLARISFHAFRKGDYEAEIYIGEGTADVILPVLLDKIELHNKMYDVAFKRGKTRNYLVSDEELLSGRQRNGVATVRNPDPTPLPFEEMERIFNEEWNKLPPINRQYSSQSGMYNLLNPPEGALTAEKLEEIGVWEVDGDDLVNRQLGLRYTWQDYLDYKPLPAPYPFKDDGAGYWFNPEEYPDITEARRYIYIVPTLLGHRPIVSGHGGRGVDYTHPSQVLGAFYSQDAELNFRLASWLIAAALRAPAQQSKTQELFHYMVIPNAPWPADWRWVQDRRGGYSALSLARCYDYLYPAIQKNEETLVQLVQPHIPWIQTTEDLYTFLDTYILQYGIQAMKTEISSAASNTAANVPEMAIIQGANDISAEWMDFSTYPVKMYPSPHSIPRTDSLQTMYNRDGTSYIASWRVYAYGTAKAIFDSIESTEEYRAMGGEIRTDFTDAEEWPKAGAAAKLILNAQIAGGYPLPIGDASGTLVEGRYPEWGIDESFVKYGWQMHKDWRFAWYLANKYGDTRPEILEAAEGRRHPELSQESRVLHGFGAGILDSGQESDDFRFKRTAILRLGTGIGHAHSDQLDLNFFAHGLRMFADLACRTEGRLNTRPHSWLPIVHNLVTIDDMRNHIWLSASANGEAWLEEFKPFVGAQYISGSADLASPRDTADVYHRQVALIDVDEGDADAAPVRTPNSYIFDVFRVHGGKLHTWNFHGPQADEFVANAELRPVGNNTFQTPDEPDYDLPAEHRSALYLRRHLAGTRYEGTAGDVFVGTWRMSRPGSTMELHTGETIEIPGGEQVIRDYFDPDSPRKYSRITLFGHDGAHVMVGNVHGYGMNTPLLHVQSADEIEERSEVYPAILEAFAGEPYIAEKRVLDIAQNDDDALRAVAIAVDTVNGRRDINFADGRPDRERVIEGNVTVAGRFAYLSRDDDGLRMAHLVGGSRLLADDIRITTGEREYTGDILEVDYRARNMVVDADLPIGLLDGQQMHIFNDDHHTAFEIVSVSKDDNGRTIIEWDGDATMLQSRVDNIDEENGVVWVQMRPPLAEYPNRDSGWTATNEAHTKFWKAELQDTEWHGDDRAMPGIYKLSGPEVKEEDFTDAADDGRITMRLYDFGPDDSFRIPTHVQIRRLEGGAFEISADTPVTVALRAEGRPVQISHDGAKWTAPQAIEADNLFTAVNLDAETLASGKIYLRIQ